MVGWGPKLHYTKLTANELYTHISVWLLLAAPLLTGYDMAQMDDFARSLLTNETGAPRKATLTVTCGDETRTIGVEQEAVVPEPAAGKSRR